MSISTAMVLMLALDGVHGYGADQCARELGRHWADQNKLSLRVWSKRCEPLVGVSPEVAVYEGLVLLQKGSTAEGRRYVNQGLSKPGLDPKVKELALRYVDAADASRCQMEFVQTAERIHQSTHAGLGTWMDFGLCLARSSSECRSEFDRSYQSARRSAEKAFEADRSFRRQMDGYLGGLDRFCRDAVDPRKVGWMTEDAHATYDARMAKIERKYRKLIEDLDAQDAKNRQLAAEMARIADDVRRNEKQMEARNRQMFVAEMDKLVKTTAEEARRSREEIERIRQDGVRREQEERDRKERERVRRNAEVEVRMAREEKERTNRNRELELRQEEERSARQRREADLKAQQERERAAVAAARQKEQDRRDREEKDARDRQAKAERARQEYARASSIIQLRAVRGPGGIAVKVTDKDKLGLSRDLVSCVTVTADILCESLFLGQYKEYNFIGGFDWKDISPIVKGRCEDIERIRLVNAKVTGC
ncbi:MAG: hypothetical protein H6686_09000 [Fibrobacteria bacterium]|nr:hypothetical protein [Fibrobacteria bacterium]